MKALACSASVPRYLLARALGKRTPLGVLPLRLGMMPQPKPPPGWRRVQVRLAGICGSDLALLYGKSSPRLSPFFSFPAVLGHEILGEVDGERVVVNPVLSCRERGLPPCPACLGGEDELCRNVAEGDIAPGGMLGFSRDFPGGWGEQIVAHPDRLHAVPADIPDSRAVLAEPLAVVVRGLRVVGPIPSPVLVIGAGTIGLLCVAALRLRGVQGEIHIAARHPLQAELAKDIRADHVHASAWDAAKAVGARPYRALIGPPAWRGGFPCVIEAAGTASSLDQAAWTVREGGKVLLLGAAGELRHDFSPYWFRAISLIGSYTYSAADFRTAVELLPAATGIERLVTHTFPLSDWRTALRTVRERRGLKVAFRP